MLMLAPHRSNCPAIAAVAMVMHGHKLRPGTMPMSVALLQICSVLTPLAHGTIGGLMVALHLGCQLEKCSCLRTTLQSGQ